MELSLADVWKNSSGSPLFPRIFPVKRKRGIHPGPGPFKSAFRETRQLAACKSCTDGKGSNSAPIGAATGEAQAPQVSA